MKIAFAVLFYLLFWAMCFFATGTDEKNLHGFRTYPNEVQERVRSDPRLCVKVPAAQPIWKVLLANFVMFAVVFSALALALRGVLGLETAKEVFWYFFALGEGLGVFDLLIIDLLWWRNTKRIRFSCAPEKALYQNPKKHIDSFIRGIPLFAATAAFAALVAKIF